MKVEIVIRGQDEQGDFSQDFTASTVDVHPFCDREIQICIPVTRDDTGEFIQTEQRGTARGIDNVTIFMLYEEWCAVRAYIDAWYAEKEKRTEDMMQRRAHQL